MKITDADAAIAKELRRRGVFDDLRENLIDDPDNIIVPCADGHQMRDLFWKHINQLERRRNKPVVHVLALNGGALLIPESSPMNKMLREDLVILYHLQGAVSMKGIKTIVLYAHCPCGAAYAQGLNLKQVITLLMEAKARTKDCLPGINVVCYCHIDYGNGKRRTYFVNRQKWEEFLKK